MPMAAGGVALAALGIIVFVQTVQLPALLGRFRIVARCRIKNDPAFQFLANGGVVAIGRVLHQRAGSGQACGQGDQGHAKKTCHSGFLHGGNFTLAKAECHHITIEKHGYPGYPGRVNNLTMWIRNGKKTKRT